MKLNIRLMILSLVIISVFLFAGINTSKAAISQDVKIWDSMVKDTDHKFYNFADSYAWANKANWKQVPYGITNYNFVGDPIIENGNFWLYLHSSGYDSPFIYGNLNGELGTVGELYANPSVDGVTYGNWARPGPRTIVKNEPGEAIMISDGRAVAPGKNLVQYRIKKGSSWLEISPKNEHIYALSLHSKTTYGVAPSENENNWVIDAPLLGTDGQANSYYMPTTYKFFMQEVWKTYRNNYTFMVIPKDVETSKLRVDVRDYYDLTSIVAVASQNIANNGVYIGVVNNKDVFRHEKNIFKPISAGKTYTSSFKPSIPGRYHVSGRVNGKYYTQIQDVKNGYIKFTSPVSGTLEVLLMYLYDRTPATPASVNTPMDIYRDAMQLSGSTVVPIPASNPAPEPGSESPLDTIPDIMNILNNAGFESGTSAWSFYTSGAGMFSIISPSFEGENAAKIVLSSDSTNVQLYQQDIILEPNTRYRLSFSAYSTTGHDLSVSLHKHDSPYIGYGLSFTADLDTNWKSFMTEFTTEGFTGAVNDGRLRFWLAPFATSGDIYYIDDVCLEKIDI